MRGKKFRRGSRDLGCASLKRRLQFFNWIGAQAVWRRSFRHDEVLVSVEWSEEYRWSRFEFEVRLAIGNMLTKIKKIIPSRIKRSIRAFLQPERFIILDSRTTYKQDGLISVMNTDFLAEEDFVEAYRLGASTGSWGSTPQNKWRIYFAMDKIKDDTKS